MIMAKGAHEVRGLLQHDVGQFSDESDVQKRLDDFYMSRIGIQIVSRIELYVCSLCSDLTALLLFTVSQLIGQYLALKKVSSSSAPDTLPIAKSEMVGLISQRASPRDIALQTISDAAYICERTHGDAPEVTIHGRTDLTFPYIPSHIHYMLLELLKNSMRATVEKHGIDNMPPIRIVIADGEDNEDVSNCDLIH